MQCLLAVFPLLLVLGCAGAHQEVKEGGRTIALFSDPEKGPRLVLVNEVELLWKARLEPDRYREATEEDMTAAEQEWAWRRILMGGTDHISGAIIPPLPEEKARAAWMNQVWYAYRELLPRTAEWDIPSRTSQAVRNVAARYPLLGAFEDQQWLDLMTNRERRIEDDRKAKEQQGTTTTGQERPQDQREASPEGSTDSSAPPAPEGPVLAPQGAAGI